MVQALQAVGLNDDPARFSDIVIQAGAEEARKILEAEARKRTEDMLGGS